MSDHFQIVWSDQPLGYSGANNLAIKLAKGQRIVLLNNDVVFLPQERNFWIQALNQPFEINPRAGISCVIKSWSDPESHEACQQEEWRLELLYRAENFLFTQGTIPHDHFATMRQHPDFVSCILPALEQIKIVMHSGEITIMLKSHSPLQTLLLGDK